MIIDVSNMTKIEAKELVKTLISSQVPVHPQTARDLYEKAEMKLPEHMKPIVWTDKVPNPLFGVGQIEDVTPHKA